MIRVRAVLEILMYPTYTPVSALRPHPADARSLRFSDGFQAADVRMSHAPNIDGLKGSGTNAVKLSRSC